MKRILVLITALGLSACGFVEKDDWMPVQTSVEIANDPELLTRYLSGHTLYSYVAVSNGGHGVQVEYNASNGKTYLWYPGNSVILEGDWKVETDETGKPVLCYKYGKNTYNPVLGTVGGNWECSKVIWSMMGDTFKGDLFNLESGELPFVIPDHKFHSIEDLYSQFGGNPEDIDYITNIGEI